MYLSPGVRNDVGEETLTLREVKSTSLTSDGMDLALRSLNKDPSSLNGDVFGTGISYGFDLTLHTAVSLGVDDALRDLPVMSLPAVSRGALLDSLPMTYDARDAADIFLSFRAPGTLAMGDF